MTPYLGYSSLKNSFPSPGATCVPRATCEGGPGTQVTPYLGYSSLKDFFPSMEIKPNPGCSNELCQQRQREWQERANSPEAVAARLAAEVAAAEEAAAPLHEDNEWQIEVVPEDEEPGGVGGSPREPGGALPAGLMFSMPVQGPIDSHREPIWVFVANKGIEKRAGSIQKLDKCAERKRFSLRHFVSQFK